MKIPNLYHKKALFVIDVQNWFIIDRNKYIIENIKKIIENVNYDLIVYSISHNEEWSLWFTQVWWTEIPKDEDTIEDLKKLISTKNYLKIKKLTKSIFKWDINLANFLKEQNIKEIHITWYETNDCVLASALESFDYGFYTFVIEEACETRTTPENHTKAIDLLKYVKLTNNSEFVWYEKNEFIKL